jgi:hypothetical protein
MDHPTDTLPEEAPSEHSETRQHETSSQLEPANNGTGHFNPALLRVIHRKGYCMLVAHWEDADALLRHDFPALNISDLELFTRDVVGPLQTLAILQRPGGLGEQFGEAIRQRLDAIGWEGTATFRALPEDCPDVTTLAERHAEEPHKFTGYILNLLADPQAQKIRSDDTASAAAGEASGDATLQEAKQAAEALLAQLQNTADVRLVFQAIARLAGLPTEVWSPLKVQLKQVLGAQLNLNDLEKARKEARESSASATGAGASTGSGASILAEAMASEWRGRVIFDQTRRHWMRFGSNLEGEGRWRELSDETMLLNIGHELSRELRDGYNWPFLQGMERLLRI